VFAVPPLSAWMSTAVGATLSTVTAIGVVVVVLPSVSTPVARISYDEPLVSVVVLSGHEYGAVAATHSVVQVGAPASRYCMVTDATPDTSVAGGRDVHRAAHVGARCRVRHRHRGTAVVDAAVAWTADAVVLPALSVASARRS
jgi:hypothetical protein